jgi:hypothetical protein
VRSDIINTAAPGKFNTVSNFVEIEKIRIPKEIPTRQN